MRKLNYQPGTWFAIPYAQGGYTVGLVTHKRRRGGIPVGYFFGTIYSELPGIEGLSNLRSEDAILIARFGDLGLFRGEWPVLGQHRAWDPAEWPMPDFVRRDVITGQPTLVRYAPEDPSKVIGEWQLDHEPPQELPEDGLAGFGYIEDKVAWLIDGHRK